MLPSHGQGPVRSAHPRHPMTTTLRLTWPSAWTAPTARPTSTSSTRTAAPKVAPWSDWAGTFYAMTRAAGMRHHAAVRALAYNWIRVIWRSWQDRLVYDETRYRAALKKHGGPIISWVEEAASTTAAA
jgi:hypothetical protein